MALRCPPMPTEEFMQDWDFRFTTVNGKYLIKNNMES